jgi:hypothetical protein
MEQEMAGALKAEIVGLLTIMHGRNRAVLINPYD